MPVCCIVARSRAEGLSLAALTARIGANEGRNVRARRRAKDVLPVFVSSDGSRELSPSETAASTSSRRCNPEPLRIRVLPLRSANCATSPHRLRRRSTMMLHAPAARAAPLRLDGVAKAFPDNQVSYAKNKGRKGKAMRGRGPPSWAPAHGYRRKRGR